MFDGTQGPETPLGAMPTQTLRIHMKDGRIVAMGSPGELQDAQAKCANFELVVGIEMCLLPMSLLH